ncbi:hypothetical protein IFM89_028029 [Coptis chinensis]|uniref:Peptide transporter n=1 Tax=Coptis chinensis TaxID=261450 RepID=A0A835HHL0_9MAGN|nr:hypothetical protein IFM89_028029 [Coptis chinensis]
MADIDVYTKDGTMTICKKPCDKEKTGTWKACPFILGNEFCERLAYYGMSTNLVNYLQKQFNQGNATAAKNVSNWSGTCYVTPLLGAFLADSYLGRYAVIAIFSVIYFIGMTLLTFSALLPGLKPSCDKGVCHPSSYQTSICFLALYLIALGTGGIKPCVSSFGADQFDDTDESEKKRKGSYFNWFYFSINVGALIASSVLVWVQMNVGWGVGFGIPAIAMGIAVVTFFSGTALFRLQRPGGNFLSRILQVFTASFKKLKVKAPSDPTHLYETTETVIQGSRKLEHTKGLSFFDKAAVNTQLEGDKGPVSAWRLCTITQVEEVKAIVRMLPIWATGIIFSAVYGQMSTMYVLQGNTMDPHLGKGFKIPSASLSIFDTISVIIWVPLYDRIIVPVARKYTKNDVGFTTLQRMGIGLFISIFAMLAAGILEVVRLRMVRTHNYYALEYVPMSILWQIPQYFLIGCAEVFTFIGQNEFFYQEAPDAMRSFCSALNLTTVALGNYLSALLVTIVTNISTKKGQLGWIPDNLNRGHIDYFYWVLVVLSVVNFIGYLFISKTYTYKKARGTVN